MPYFKDEQEVYDYIGKLFQDLAKDDELWSKFRRANTIVQYQFRNPESQITVKMRENEEAQVDLGPTELEPEVLMTMEADTAHRFWLGKVNVTVALARGQIKEHLQLLADIRGRVRGFRDCRRGRLRREGVGARGGEAAGTCDHGCAAAWPA